MNVLVTGGAGFIGSHIVKRLLAGGHEVVVVDNMNQYYDPALKRARLAEFKDKITFYEEDIADLSALTAIFQKHRFDKICHLAAQAGVRYSLVDPYAYARSNYVGTQNILELARVQGSPHIVFASSSSVYGASIKMPFTEDDPCDSPLSAYAASKRACELLASVYARLFGMRITALRFFTVCGPWSRPDMAPILFTERILSGEPLDLHNGGDMKRDFTYIDDIVDGFVLALENAPEGFDIFNLGRGEPVVIKDFLAILEKTLGKKAKVAVKPMQPGEVLATWASTEKAQRMLGFAPKVSIEEGVARFVGWYRDYFKA